MVLGVFREVDLVPLDRRGPGALGRLDLAAMLGVSGQRPADRHALLLRRPGRRPVVALADAVMPVPPEVEWRPLPMVPPMAADLFDAVGQESPQQGGLCHFRVRESRLERIVSRAVAALGPARLTGWVRAPDLG
jgi:hypothetical protein